MMTRRCLRLFLALLSSLALSGCLSDGSELLPENRADEISESLLSVSAGLQPQYTWPDSFGDMRNLFVVRTENPDNPVWQLQSTDRARISPPIRHGVEPNQSGVQVVRSNESTLTAGVEYRIQIEGTGGLQESRVFVAQAASLRASQEQALSALAGGEAHSLSTAEGSWGADEASPQGDSAHRRLSPDGAVPNPLAMVAAGARHSAALTAGGQLWTWGANGFGQLGDGTTNDRTTPRAVAALPEIVAVAAGDAHTLALAADGHVWAWGANDAGQLGHGDRTPRLTPVRIDGLTEVVTVAAGARHSLARTADGQLWAWGANDRGQLGDGTAANRSQPVRIRTAR